LVPPPRCLAVDAENVYWANAGDGRVMQVPIGGGTPITLASGQAIPDGITVDATHVYWTNNAVEGSVMKAIRFDATSLYWTADGAGKVMTMAK
jgi:sugar lactone lactonase YvrE